MSRETDRRPYRYDPASTLAPEHNQNELAAPLGNLNSPRHSNESHDFVYEQRTIPQAPESSPSPSESDNTVITDHEETVNTDGEPPKPLPPTKTTKVSKWRIKWLWMRRATEEYWLTEFGSCLVAVGVLVALVCVLRQHDGQPLPEWKYGITLNALVSVLSSILKAAAVLPLAGGISQTKWLWYAQSRPLVDMESFDDASRGPWGSLLLLLDFRSHYIASFGAFLTLIAMAVDPFTQQIIQTQPCLWKDASAAAFIPRANIYNASFSLIHSEEFDPEIASAIYSGLISPSDNISSIIQPICVSGNCSFPEVDGKAYQSIAMCHRCDNITTLVNNSATEYGKWGPSLPSGASLGSMKGNRSSGFMSLYTTLQNSTVRADSNHSLLDVEMLMYTNQTGPEASVGWKDRGQYRNIWTFHLLGARCSLIPCMKTYMANISRGVLEEHELSSENLERDGDYFSIVSDRVVRNGVLRNCSTTLNQTAENTIRMYGHTYAFQLVYDPPVPLTWTSEDCYWELSGLPGQSIASNMRKLFDNKNLTFSPDKPADTMGDVWLQNLYRNGAANMSTVDRFMGSLANSITQLFRTKGFHGPAMWAKGDVLAQRTCVRVNWPWIAFPATLLALVPVFIGLTMLSTLRSRWREYGLKEEPTDARIAFLKSNPLPLLFFGLHRDVLDETDPSPNTTVNMQDVAQKTHVALEWCWIDGQWKFVKPKST